MFDNLLAQNEVKLRLTADIAADKLPPTLLFTGPAGSGKTTAALELARVLSCDRGGAWSCACSSCARHRVLAHSDTLILGARNFPEEIATAREMLSRAWGKPAMYFFIRAVRKLLRRFDAVLYSGEDAKLGKAAPLIRDIEESLQSFSPESIPAEPEEKLLSAAEEIAASCSKLESFVPDQPPVFMVRNMEAWSRLAPFGRRKTVLIENADRMLDSSRNALLKILEEPPETVRFVLTTARRGAMLATILSRSRTYPFKVRDQAESALVIERIFRSSEKCPTVEAFLAGRRSFTPARADAFARDFLAAALSARSSQSRLDPPLEALARAAAGQERDGPAILAEILDATKDFGARDERFATSFDDFLAALARATGSLLREAGSAADTVRLAGTWSAMLRDARIQHASYNRSPALLAETLFYSMGEPR